MYKFYEFLYETEVYGCQFLSFLVEFYENEIKILNIEKEIKKFQKF